jgi:hypothetical protein
MAALVVAAVYYVRSIDHSGDIRPGGLDDE